MDKSVDTGKNNVVLQRIFTAIGKLKGLKKMKKTLTLLLSMTVLCCALTACGNRDKGNDSRTENAKENTTEVHSATDRNDEFSSNTDNVNGNNNNNNNNNGNNNNNHDGNGNIVTKAGDIVDDLVSTGEDIVDDAGSVVEDAGDAILGTDRNDNAR
ncbi:hypothetical protein [Porcipelethomonas sp.]|uniref:hypothetical protein n=1 Tax=Porcipelethomonas sp. TaxID=2981675 RepID=UPI003EF68528